jgi:ankyrin repeat protein
MSALRIVTVRPPTEPELEQGLLTMSTRGGYACNVQQGVEAVSAALAARDVTRLHQLSGVDLNRIVVSSAAGPRTLLDHTLREGDVQFLRDVLALPGVSSERSLPAHGYWAWAQSAPLSVIVAFAEAAGADLNARDADGLSLLHEVASGDGAMDVVAWLLDRVDADPVANDGTTPFYRAAGGGRLDVAQALYARGANPNVANRVTGWTALITSVAAGLEGVTAWLLSLDRLDVNLADLQGATALHHAARLGSTGALETLIAHPAVDCTRIDIQGRTPLMDAARHANAEAVRVLLEPEHAGVNRVDADRRTALHHAVAAGSAQAVELLLARPDVNLAIRDRLAGRTALDVALADDDEPMADRIRAAIHRVGPQGDAPDNEPSERADQPPLGDPDQFPSIADPPGALEGEP